MERQATAAAGLPSLNHLLQHTLRSLCTDSQWVYAVFWRILPRHYPPPKWETEGGVEDRSRGNKRNWILVWEDGFCNFSVYSSGQALESNITTTSTTTDQSLNPELFFKMSHEVYNYGEGLMGKVAADNSHKWVYRDPLENGMSSSSFLPPWHGSLDPHPRTWEAQFKAGIQTVAVVAVQEGLLQLGSTAKIVEDLNFVILMQRNFNYLQSIPGVFGPHPMSSNCSSQLPMSSSSAFTCKRPPVQLHGAAAGVDHEQQEQSLQSPPPEPAGVRGNWNNNNIMSPDQADHDLQTRFSCMSNNGYCSSSTLQLPGARAAAAVAAVDQFLLSLAARSSGTNGWRSSLLHDSASIVGMKKRAATTVEDHPPADYCSDHLLHMSPTISGLSLDVKDSSSSRCYSSSTALGTVLRSYVGGASCWPPECPSPPKALNVTGTRCSSTTTSRSSSSLQSMNHHLIPSMSSLHALLSKLPSVTPELEQQQQRGADSNAAAAASGHHVVDHAAPCNNSSAAGPSSSCNYGSPPAGAGAGAASSSASPDHHLHPPIANCTAAPDQSSDSRPGYSHGCSCTPINAPVAAAASDHESFSCNNNCNCNAAGHADDQQHGVISLVTTDQAFHMDAAGCSSTCISNVNATASAAAAALVAVSAAGPILSASVVTADQRFHEHRAIADLRSRDIQIAASFDNFILPDAYFGQLVHDHQDALENNNNNNVVDNYNSIFSEIINY